MRTEAVIEMHEGNMETESRVMPSSRSQSESSLLGVEKSSRSLPCSISNVVCHVMLVTRFTKLVNDRLPSLLKTKRFSFSK